VSGRRLIKVLLYESRRTHFDFRNELVAMREGLRGGSRVESRTLLAAIVLGKRRSTN
jgi:hypothetical protein